jgi:hypothetical protein
MKVQVLYSTLRKSPTTVHHLKHSLLKWRCKSCTPPEGKVPRRLSPSLALTTECDVVSCTRLLEIFKSLSPKPSHLWWTQSIHPTTSVEWAPADITQIKSNIFGSQQTYHTWNRHLTDNWIPMGARQIKASYSEVGEYLCTIVCAWIVDQTFYFVVLRNCKQKLSSTAHHYFNLGLF